MSDPQKDDGGGARGRPPTVDAGGAREMDSPRFRAIMRVTSGRRKRAPDVKSFSHELSAGAGVPAMRKMVRGGGLIGGGTGTAPEEFIGAVRTKFIRLKEEVDSELGVFAGDLVGVLERGDDLPEDRRLALEDLLVAAQRCAEMSPEEFWTRCEGIVQGLDDRRQELPAGFPKQAHTRILFILTRCTRLLQFQKEAAAAGCRYAGDDGTGRQHVLGLHQLSDLGLFPSRADGGDLGRKSTSSLTELKERLIRRRMLEHKHLIVDFSPARIFSSGDGAGGAAENSPSGRMASWKKLPSPAEKNRNAGAGGGAAADATATAADEKKKPIITRPQGKPSVDEIVERVDAASIHPDGLACLGGGDGGAAAIDVEVSSQYPAAQQIIVDGKPRMICRICDFEIPMACAEGHLVVCTLADRCDAKGHTADQRLLRVADVLGRVLACFAGGGAGRPSTSSSGSSNPNHDALSHLLAVPSAELFSEGALSPVPVSLPYSPLPTPRTSHAESQLARHFHAGFGENFQQIESLLAIARGIESIKSSDYNSLEDLSSFLEDLNAVIDTRKVDALVVETFGRRIAKLLQ
jgi:hypothetical protein